jgi:hypothetical protein
VTGYKIIYGRKKDKRPEFKYIRGFPHVRILIESTLNSREYLIHQLGLSSLHLRKKL